MSNQNNPKSQASGRPASQHTAQQQTAQREARQAADEHERRDEENKRRFVDQSGIVAQDLPDGAHGQNVVDHPSEMTRNLPHQHGGGGEAGGEGGVRGDRNMSDADDHGGRKHN